MGWWGNLTDRWFGDKANARADIRAAVERAQATYDAEWSNPDNIGRDVSLISAIPPFFEQGTPQYPPKAPWNLGTSGYTKNELAFACINRRAGALADATMQIYDQPDKKARKVLHDHPARALLAKPNVSMGEADFWKATEIFLCTAGFAAWEIEMNNKGEPIGLWPMRPHWCSFVAGNGLPVRAVRYQPDGLSQPMYVPIDRVLLFTEFNPLRPQISSLSRTAVALRSIEADNAATDFLALFFQQGASMPGVLVTDQVLNDSEAERIKARWRDVHGGYQNWGDVAVLGKGTRYEPVSQTFKEMDFSNIDGRDEARICTVFEVPAMLVGAKVGLNASTYSNYAEARKAFYEETIVPRWKWFESIIDAQLLPKFDGDTKTWPAFDLSDVRALAEDETAKWARAQGAAGMNLITRDEARVLIGFDAIDNGEPVWLGGNAGAGQPEPEGDEPAGDMPMGANEMTDNAKPDPLTGEATVATTPKAPTEPAKPDESVDEDDTETPANEPSEPAELVAVKPLPDTGETTDDVDEVDDAGDKKPKKKPTPAPAASEDVKKALSAWRKAEIECVKNHGVANAIVSGFSLSQLHAIGAPMLNAISNDLHDAHTASDVRAVFERHWPTDAPIVKKARPTQNAPGAPDAPPDDADRRRSEKRISAAMSKYFEGLINRMVAEVG